MTSLRYHSAVKAEVKAAFDYYWDDSQSAALNFNRNLQAAYRKLRKYPRLYPEYLHGTRRVLLDRYPYFVVFRELDDAIQIIAVAHAKRRPGYWKTRLKH
jgi:toxin ParE1/3/4